MQDRESGRVWHHSVVIVSACRDKDLMDGGMDGSWMDGLDFEGDAEGDAEADREYPGQ